MARPSVVFLLFCVSAVIIGSYMAIAPTEGRPDYLEAMFKGSMLRPSLG